MPYKINKKLSILLLICSFIFSISCSKKRSCIPSPDISTMVLTLETERLDKEMFKIHTRKELQELLNQHPVFSETFLARFQYPNDSIFINQLLGMLENPSIDTLWQETQVKFGDLNDIIQQFEDAFKRISYYYPEYSPPKIQFGFSGLGHDMFVSDSLVIIGLDYFLGEGATFRPLQVPEYILKRYRKENIVPNSLLLVSEKYNRVDIRDKTLLADMIFYGKAFYFAKQMLPCVADSVFLGYSPQEMQDIFHGQEIIWANFIQNEALFDTNHIIKDKFISERPKTFEIGQNCPGRIGRWVGWEIVKSYMENNPEVDLPGLMRNDNARNIFEKSGFKPRNKNI